MSTKLSIVIVINVNFHRELLSKSDLVDTPVSNAKVVDLPAKPKLSRSTNTMILLP
jgi:hypothetical protein